MSQKPTASGSQVSTTTPPASHASHLAEAGSLIGPVVDGEHGERGVEGSSSKGSDSAPAWTTGAASGGRWAIITADGSTATTSRSTGS